MTTNDTDTNAGKEWAEGINKHISHNMRAHRKEQSLTVQQVSDRTKELGYEIPKTTLTNIELGRKASVSVQELLIISRALRVAPGDLLTNPRTPVAPVELYPGKVLPSVFAFHDLARERNHLAERDPQAAVGNVDELPDEANNLMTNLNSHLYADKLVNLYIHLFNNYQMYRSMKSRRTWYNPDTGAESRIPDELRDQQADIHMQAVQLQLHNVRQLWKSLEELGVTPFSPQDLWGEKAPSDDELPPLLRSDSEFFNAS